MVVGRSKCEGVLGIYWKTEWRRDLPFELGKCRLSGDILAAWLTVGSETSLILRDGRKVEKSRVRMRWRFSCVRLLHLQWLENWRRDLPFEFGSTAARENGPAARLTLGSHPHPARWLEG